MSVEVDEKQRHYVQQEFTALNPYISRHSVSLIFVGDNGAPTNICSGTCVVLRGALGIATAAHEVMRHAREKISICYTPRLSPLNQFVELVVLEGGGKHDSVDVAFIKLNEEGVEAIRLYKEFLPEDRLVPGVSHLENDRVIIYGTPVEYLDTSKFDEQILGACKSNCVTAHASLPCTGGYHEQHNERQRPGTV